MEMSIQEQKMDRLWDYMTTQGIATNEEIGLATALCGKNLDTLEKVLYIKTGYRSLEQIEEEYDENEGWED